MKINILKVLLTFLPFFCYSQKQGNVWYFGNHAGLDFNNTTPLVLSDGNTYNNSITQRSEGTAVICDSSGALLFYTNGEKIWNKDHQIMSNGNDLMGHMSSTQSSLIIPKPNTNNIFYLFTTDAFEDNFLQNGLRYSVIDMCLNNKLGGVVPNIKNILLLDTVSEKLTAIKHGNNVDYWVITHKHYSDAFYCYLITNNGITDTIISHVGSFHPNGQGGAGTAIGQLKASPDGNKLAIVNGNSSNSIAEYFSFDKNTGVVSNSVSIQTNSAYNYYGVSFSPDNSKIYLSCWLNDIGVYQFNLNAGNGNPDSVRASKYQVSSNLYYSIQLAVNNKIYLARSSQYVSVIDNPNNLGLQCNFIDSAIYLNSGSCSFGLPNFLDNYLYDNTIVSQCDSCAQFPDTKFNYSSNNLTINFIDQSGGITPNNWFWDFGDGSTSTEQNPQHAYDSAGIYIVTFIACENLCCDTIIDTVTVVGVGINDFYDLSNTVTIFPNPVNNALVIETTFSSKLNYYIYDVTGKLLQTGIFNKNKNIDVGGFAKGVYVVQLQSQQGKVSKKFVKE